MLVSPAEPKPFHKLGIVSPVTERYGADFIIASKTFGSVGIQRKEVNDLISSVGDGRLQKELLQMKALGLGVLVIEGRLQWTDDGLLLANSSWTVSQMRGLLWSVQSRGIWTASTISLDETISWLLSFEKWLTKERHNSLAVRPNGAKNTWGKADDRDYGIWLLQSFEGIGYEVACRIYDHFKGVPLRWTVTAEELRAVKGIGKGRAERLTKALQPSSSDSSATSPSPTRGANWGRPESKPEPYIELDQM